VQHGVQGQEREGEAPDCQGPAHRSAGGRVFLMTSSSTQSTDLNVSLKNAFIQTSRIIFGQKSGYCGLAKLTHKIHHHRSIHIPSPRGIYIIIDMRAHLGDIVGLVPDQGKRACVAVK